MVIGSGIGVGIGIERPLGFGFDDAREKRSLIDADTDADTDPEDSKIFMFFSCPQRGPFFPGAVREKRSELLTRTLESCGSTGRLLGTHWD